MQNPVVQKAAKYYKDKFIQEASILSNAKDSLTSKLYEFSTDKSKYDFMGLLRNDVYKELIDHRAQCTMKNCQTEERLQTALFVLDEEREVMSTYYAPKLEGEDGFSPDDISNLNVQLNEVVKLLIAGGMAQEIVFNEIEELREQIGNMSKKTWYEFVKGKLIDLSFKYTLTPEIISKTFKTIAHDFGFTFNFLN